MQSKQQSRDMHSASRYASQMPTLPTCRTLPRDNSWSRCFLAVRHLCFSSRRLGAFKGSFLRALWCWGRACEVQHVQVHCTRTVVAKAPGAPAMQTKRAVQDEDQQSCSNTQAATHTPPAHAPKAAPTNSCEMWFWRQGRSEVPATALLLWTRSLHMHAMRARRRAMLATSNRLKTRLTRKNIGSVSGRAGRAEKRALVASKDMCKAAQGILTLILLRRKHYTWVHLPREGRPKQKIRVCVGGYNKVLLFLSAAMTYLSLRICT